jgi:hypothetical protein
MAVMATSNSSIPGDEPELTGPGHRTGEGAGSVLPYLHETFATRPGELFPSTPPKPKRRSLASRVRKALLGAKDPGK